MHVLQFFYRLEMLEAKVIRASPCNETNSVLCHARLNRDLLDPLYRTRAAKHLTCSTYQTTRGNNRPSAPCALHPPWVSPGLFPPWLPLQSSISMFSFGLPLGLPWAFLGPFLAVSGLFSASRPLGSVPLVQAIPAPDCGKHQYSS